MLACYGFVSDLSVKLFLHFPEKKKEGTFISNTVFSLEWKLTMTHLVSSPTRMQKTFVNMCTSWCNAASLN
jgi:hypothetical protein